MMKHLLKGAMLVCMVLIFLSSWSLPTARASVTSPANGRTSQEPTVLNSSGIGKFYTVATVPGNANNAWAVGDGIGTLIEHWNGSVWRVVKSPNVVTHPRAS